MTNLFDEVQQLSSESHAKWFERYFNKIDIENRIKILAAKGKTTGTIQVDDKKDNYLKGRLVNPKTIGMLRDRLGEGFSVELKTETIQNNIFPAIKTTKTYIEILW